MMKINWDQLRTKLREDIVILPHFFRNPIQTMRALPDWEWPTIVVLQAAFAAAISTLANLVARDFVAVITGLILAPITNYILLAVAAGFFYYIFDLFFRISVSYRQIYIILLFATIPLLILSVAAIVVPPLMLLGSATALLLLFVGFVDRLRAPVKPLRNILLGLMAIHVLYWGFQQVQTSTKHKTLRQKATPESLDILEKELNTED